MGFGAAVLLGAVPTLDFATILLDGGVGVEVEEFADRVLLALAAVGLLSLSMLALALMRGLFGVTFSAGGLALARARLAAVGAYRREAEAGMVGCFALAGRLGVTNGVFA